jgi:hypothetical protein
MFGAHAIHSKNFRIESKEANCSLHEERCLAEHVVLHYDTCKISQDFQNETAGHGEGKAMSATPNPENKLNQEEKCEYYGEQEVGSRVWHVVNIGVLKRAKVYRTICCGGDV